VTPTPAAMVLINGLVNAVSGGWAGNGDVALVAALNSPTSPNPTPQGTIYTPFTVMQVENLLTSTDLAAVLELPEFGGDQGMLNLLEETPQTAETVTELNDWAESLAAANKITSTELSALQSLFNATESDPSWPATVPTISLPSQLGRLCDIADIAATRAVYAPETRD
jgi:hypothetical protein